MRWVGKAGPAVLIATVFSIAGSTSAQPASLGAAIDTSLDDTRANLGTLTRDEFVRSLVAQGFRCKAMNDRAIDVACTKDGIGKGGKFLEGTLHIGKLILSLGKRECDAVSKALVERGKARAFVPGRGSGSEGRLCVWGVVAASP